MRKLSDGGRNENGAGDLHGAGLMVLGNDVYHGCDLPSTRRCFVYFAS